MSTSSLNTGSDLEAPFLADRTVPANIAEISALIRRELERCGWCHCQQKLSLEEYERLGRSLGEIELQTDIRVDAEKVKSGRPNDQMERSRPTVYSPQALDLHTDRPTADVVGWYCVEQDAQDGTLRMVDARPILAGLEPEDLVILESVPVRFYMPNMPDGNGWFAEPLLVPAHSHYEVFFAPWLLPPDLSAEQRAAVAKFQQGLDEQATAAGLQVRLAPGESLFIDNRRLLHGRGAISPDSRRHLIRYYIQWREKSARPLAPWAEARAAV